MTSTDAFPEARWRAAPVECILWANWGGDHIAFHRPSGKTHLLNDVSWRLLTGILVKPQCFEDIIGALAGSPEDVNNPRFAAELAAMLERFEQLGLIERT